MTRRARKSVGHNVLRKEGVENRLLGRFNHGGKERIDDWMPLVPSSNPSLLLDEAGFRARKRAGESRRTQLLKALLPSGLHI